MRRRDLVAGTGLLLLAGPALAQTSLANTLEEVKKRGLVRVGVRQDVPGFGIVDEKGATVGFDVDIATELAKRLGVKIELVPVTAATRIPLHIPYARNARPASVPKSATTGSETHFLAPEECVSREFSDQS